MIAFLWGIVYLALICILKICKKVLLMALIIKMERLVSDCIQKVCHALFFCRKDFNAICCQNGKMSYFVQKAISYLIFSLLRQQIAFVIILGLHLFTIVTCHV